MDADRYKQSQSVAVLGICGNGFLIALKLVAGLMTKSNALIADAGNSLGDILSSLITYVGNMIANKPKDKGHPYGHGKAETIGTLLVGVVICMVAFEIAKTSVLSLMRHAATTYSWVLIAAPLVVAAVKTGMYLYAYEIGKRHNNLLVLANAKDHICDVIVSAFTVLSGLATLKGILWADGVIGAGIGIWIGIQGFGICREAVAVLMDAMPTDDIFGRIENALGRISGVKGVSSFAARPLGIGYHIDVTVKVACDVSTARSHELASLVESRCKDMGGESLVRDVVVHVEPLCTNRHGSCQECGLSA